MRAVYICVVVVVLLAGSCGGSPSLADYTRDLEVLVTTMNARLDQLEGELDGTQDLEDIKRYAEQRVIARSEFVAGLRDLEPSDDVVTIHDSAIGIMERLTAAESALAEQVMLWESASDIVPIWETPEGIAARAVDAEAVALCLAAQAEIDQTADRAEFEDVPWIPSDMKEVVRVAFGCEADSR